MKTVNEIKSNTPNRAIKQSDLCVNQQNKTVNEVTKDKYFEVLAAIKELFDRQGIECFERDYTKFPNGNPTAMHCYLNNEVYWTIICDDCDIFYVQYHFNNCRFQAQIKASFDLLSNSERLSDKGQSNLQLAFELCKDFEDASFFSF